MKLLKILSCFVFIFMNCAYVFETGSELASFQDKKFDDFQFNNGITNKEKVRLERNLWVWTATDMAPGNLVIRQLCLIDLFNGKTVNYNLIMEQLDKVGGVGLFLEGYSYWIYTKPFLVKYYEVFKSPGLKIYVDQMDKKFLTTAYVLHGGIPRPAPFGDIADITLEYDVLALENIADNAEVFPVTKKTEGDTVTYTIEACAVGLNAHIPKKADTVVISGGVVYKSSGKMLTPYEWYPGWEGKYNSRWDELMDVFDYRRVNSITVGKWWAEIKGLK